MLPTTPKMAMTIRSSISENPFERRALFIAHNFPFVLRDIPPLHQAAYPRARSFRGSIVETVQSYCQSRKRTYSEASHTSNVIFTTTGNDKSLLHHESRKLGRLSAIEKTTTIRGPFR
jgi:hypothetical protein